MAIDDLLRRNDISDDIRRELRQELAERSQVERDLALRTHELGRRLGELVCLHTVSAELQRTHLSVGEALRGVVELIPAGWLYPEITCARITYQDRKYSTQNFDITPWGLTADILALGEPVGVLDVRYLEQRPPRAEGPFLRQERFLLDSIAARLGAFLEQKRVEAALRRGAITQAASRDDHEDGSGADALSSLLPRSNDLMAVVDPESGSFLDVNGALCVRLGYSREQLLRRGMADLDATLADPAQWARHLREVRSRGGALQDGAGRRADGTPLFAELAATHVLHQGREYLVVVGRDVTERKKSDEAARLLRHRLLATQEDERNRLSRALQGEVASCLGAAQSALRDLMDRPEAKPLAEPIQSSLESIDQAIRCLRRLCLDLRPPLLDDLGLVDALRLYVAHQTQDLPITPHFTAETTDTPLPPQVQIGCFRIAQEALANLRRHAGAREAWVALTRRGPDLVLSVRDDGVGFDLESARRQALLGRGLGLFRMEERASLLRGCIEIRSSPGKGTEVLAVLPIGGVAGTPPTAPP